MTTLKLRKHHSQYNHIRLEKSTSTKYTWIFKRSTKYKYRVHGIFWKRTKVQYRLFKKYDFSKIFAKFFKNFIKSTKYKYAVQLFTGKKYRSTVHCTVGYESGFSKSYRIISQLVRYDFLTIKSYSSTYAKWAQKMTFAKNTHESSACGAWVGNFGKLDFNCT